MTKSPIICNNCKNSITLPLGHNKSAQCTKCETNYLKKNGVWDFRIDHNVGSQKSLAIYREPEFQRWLDIFENVESKNWKIYDSALKRFFSHSGHRLLGRYLSKSISKNDLVVEVGAGNGALHKFTNLENYIGIDTNWDMLCQLASSFPNKTLICTSVGDLPIADSSVNAFVTLHTLEHIYHLAETFEEIIRILAPNGKHLFVIPCEGGLPFSLGRTFITGPNLKRKYNLDIDMVMSREHINDAPRVLKFLKLYFSDLEYRYWPFPFLPLLNVNVMIWGKCKARLELLSLIDRTNPN